MKHLLEYYNFLLEKENKIIYTAYFIDDVEKLKEIFPPVHPNIFYHHSTIEFRPIDISNLEIGKKEKVKVTGRLTTDNVDVLLVDLPKFKNKNPHITLSTADGINPAQSKSEIENNLSKIEKIDNLFIDVTEGYYDGRNCVTEKTNEELISYKRQNTLVTKPYTAGDLEKKLKKLGYIDGRDNPEKGSKVKLYTGYSDGYNIRVLIKGDGNNEDRTFDLNIDNPEDVSAIAYQSFDDGESEWIELFFKDIQEILQDLNK